MRASDRQGLEPKKGMALWSGKNWGRFTGSVAMRAVAVLGVLVVAGQLTPSATPIGSPERALARPAVSVLTQLPHRSPRSARHALTRAEAARAYGRLPLSFEANRGQTDPRVKFMARGAGYTLFLTPRGSVLALRKPHARARAAADPVGTFRKGAHAARAPAKFATLGMRLVGANSNPSLEGLAGQPGRSNYLVGRDRKAWHTGVPSYASALSRGVYPGVDLLYHGRQGQLEYDFKVAPGADPSRIALAFAGVHKLSIDRHGNLHLGTGAGTIRQNRPVAYQLVAGKRHRIAVSFKLQRGNRVAFDLGAYDKTKPLTVDPVVVYSTYLGGLNNDQGMSIAADGAGNAYVVGSTPSPNFPVTPGAVGTTYGGSPTAFVSKLNPSGSALVYSTYLGGTGYDFGTGIAVDAAGAAYVTGSTYSTDLPTTPGAFQSTSPGGGNSQVGYVAKLAPDGASLGYMTYLGGTAYDAPAAIAINGSGNAYVGGYTASTDFPTQNPVQATERAAANYGGNAFVTELNPAGSALVYSTYLGGSTDDQATAVAVDASGSAYLTGSSRSSDFPTTAGAFQTTHAPGYEPFVAKLNPSGSALAYSTMLGGSSGEGNGRGIAVGRGAADAGHAYITGSTSASDFPTTGAAYQGTFQGGYSDAFVAELAADGSGLDYSTFLGSDGEDSAAGIAVDGAGNAYVIGDTSGSNFPQVRPVATNTGGGGLFATQLQSGGSDLGWSVLLSGGNTQGGGGIAVDPAGAAYLTGTATDGLTTQNPLQPKSAGGQYGGGDAFVAKLAPDVAQAPYVTGVSPRGDDVAGGRAVTITGSGFSYQSTVKFGTVPATNVQTISPTEIVATTPAEPAGLVNVTVTTAGGTSPPNPNNRFVYADGRWTTINRPSSAESDRTATLLDDGKVLVAGGQGVPGASGRAAELYDPTTDTWAPTGSLNVATGSGCSGCGSDSATLLRSGKVLLVHDTGNNPGIAEVYDPSTGTWTVTAGAPTSHQSEGSTGTATLLPSGKVLLTGNGNTELYDPTTDSFAPTSHQPSQNYVYATATLLPDGTVLLVSGNIAELYNPASDTFSGTAGPTNSYRFASATLLPSGKVLLAGSAPTAEVYDPASGNWSQTQPQLSPGRMHGAALLPNGKVLITPGYTNPTDQAELYDPTLGANGGFTSAGLPNADLFVPSSVGPTPSAIVLSSNPRSFAADPAVCGPSCGKVLYVGTVKLGQAYFGHAELYAPHVSGPGPASPPSDSTVQGQTLTGAGSGGPGAGSPGAGPGGAGPGGGPPKVTGYRITNNPFVVAAAPTRITATSAATKHKRGTTFKYTLSEAATVKIVISRRVAGRRSGTRCVAPTKRLRNARACTRIIVRGTLKRVSHPGANRVAFSGRIGSKALRLGRYQATLTARDVAKRASKPQRILFRIVKR